MTEAEMVARLIVAKNGRDVEDNIDSVIQWLCAKYEDRGRIPGTPTLMEQALTLLDGRVERGVGLNLKMRK